jgi:hypothetical protein
LREEDRLREEEWAMRRTGMLVALGVLLAVTLSACGGERVDRAATAAPDVAQARAIAANLLAAYNSGDYRTFSRDLSLPARLIVDEDAFAQFRTANLPVTGAFAAITGVEPAPGQQGRDHLGYQVHAEFQHHDDVVLVLTVSRAGKIDGLEFQPRNQR